MDFIYLHEITMFQYTCGKFHMMFKMYLKECGEGRETKKNISLLSVGPSLHAEMIEPGPR